MPAKPEHPEQKAPKRNENPIRREKLKPDILEIDPSWMGRLSGFSRMP